MASSKLATLLAVGSVAALLGACAVETQDEEEMGETGSHLLAGTRLTPAQVAGALRSAGWPENMIGKMVCTAKYESSYYSRAINTKNKNGSVDRGLFQINSIHLNGGTKGCPKGAEALFDVDTNAKCALAIYKSQGIKAWYGYRSHKKECDATKAPGSAALPEETEEEETETETGDEETPEKKAPAPVVDPEEPDNGGGCWSESLQDMKDGLSCVQGKSNKVWFQCKDGKWYRGGDDVSGPYGDCNGSFPAK
ncbi:MAG: hypothetical protein KIT84_06510 [Labilithrix sp.]|nr:hypothetical protein [Labilithrix sp.]MCW5810645.1 hypothetical protein [Labilithrix sp.]